jgi:hypothetical protein
MSTSPWATSWEVYSCGSPDRLQASKDPIGWILLADVVLWMLTGMMAYYGVYGVASPGSIPLPLIVAGINNVMWVPTVGVLGTYVFLHFPEGRLPSRRWRPPAWLAGG